jgi:hypothetical protein
MTTTTTPLTQNTTAVFPSTTPTPSQDDPFCITCGFDFGKIIDGVDNKIAGFGLVFLAFMVLCSPCIGIACCYLFGKVKKRNASKKGRRKKGRGRFQALRDNDDDELEDEFGDDDDEDARH